MLRRASVLILLFAAALLASCGVGPKPSVPSDSAPRLQPVLFLDPTRPTPAQNPIKLRGARNEIVHFAIQINRFPRIEQSRTAFLRLSPLKGEAENVIPHTSFSVYQPLVMPVDSNHAGFVRHTGLPANIRQMPRALLPLTLDNTDLNLITLRHPDTPLDPDSHPAPAGANPILLWFDLHIPPTITPGDYRASFDLIEEEKVAASLSIELLVDDFVLGDERRLAMAGRLDWTDLARHYPSQFNDIHPNRLSRADPQHARAIAILDELVKLAHAHRTQLIIPALQPIVKWPSGSPPQVDWKDYDSVVGPWLKGNAFPDLTPMGYWPLPQPDRLHEYDPASQAEYWSAAAGHFDANGWLVRSSVAMRRASEGRVTLEESIRFSEEATRILAAHPGLRVTVPLEEEQVQLATPANPKRIPPESAARLLYAAPGLVWSQPIQQLPPNTGSRWLRTDLPGLLPHIGAGADEREVRLWAWLAFVRDAQLIQWNSPLPSRNGPSEPAEPDELIWFYPGAWFGLAKPLPSIHLKWLRRAQQDYEYLSLARQRGQGTRAMTLARLLTRPVEIQPAQRPDPIYALMSGTSDPQAWAEAMELLAGTVLLSQPGQTVNPAAEKRLDFQTSAWTDAQGRPMLLARSADWAITTDSESKRRFASLRLGVDIYNAADRQPERNRLQWSTLPQAWDALDRPADVAKLNTYRVDRAFLDARVALDKVSPDSRKPLRLAFIDGFTSKIHPIQIALPVAWCELRQGSPPIIDGSFGDWLREDALHNGPLVNMLSRPALQKQELPLASTPSAIYSTWTSANLYLGFSVNGVQPAATGAGRNWVEHKFRRAWAEDICEMLIQPIYDDNSAGPLLYLAVKPGGQLDTARRLDRRLNANPWQAFVASDIRYFATLDQSTWRGELAIPWEAINDESRANKRPVALRFNFTQHQGPTGQSASWAGPVDFGRDEQFMGLLEVR